MGLLILLENLASFCQISAFHDLEARDHSPESFPGRDSYGVLSLSPRGKVDLHSGGPAFDYSA
jgi:hypothetical protein